MKMKLILLSGIFSLAFILSLTSCKKDVAPPLAEIFFQADATNPYAIKFTVAATNADTYSWNFGDQKGTSTEKEPQYTFSMSGDYTVSLTAKGEGGEVTVTKKVSIAASLLEMLTGGPAATSGKTWVLSKTASSSDGAASFGGAQYQPAPSDVLTMFGLGAEYDNEFTFNNNGSYSVAPKNSNVLSSVIHAYVNQTISGEPAWALGLAAAKYTAPTGATFALNEGDLKVTVREENPQTGTVSAVKEQTFSKVKYLTFTKGFFGILTYNTTVIIRDITSTRLVVSMLVSTLSPEVYPADYEKPSIMYTLSFDKK